MLPLYVPLLVTATLACLGYLLAKQRAIALSGGDIRSLAALPHQYGLNTLLAITVPSLAVLLGGALAGGGSMLGWIVIGVATLCLIGSLAQISHDYRARTHAESWIKLLLIGGLGHRHPDHRWHRVLDAVRDPQLLYTIQLAGLFFLSRMVAQLSGRFCLGYPAAIVGNTLH